MLPVSVNNIRTYCYLHQKKLDENNSSQQVQTAVQQYIQYTMVCSCVASDSVLAANGDTTSVVSPNEKSLERAGSVTGEVVLCSRLVDDDRC